MTYPLEKKTDVELSALMTTSTSETVLQLKEPDKGIRFAGFFSPLPSKYVSFK